MKNLIRMACMTGLLWMSFTARAHHGWAAFGSGPQVTLQGTVTDFHFVNPHSVVDFEVKDAEGKIQEWEGLLSSPSRLAPQGWTAASLEPGDKITISGHVTKNGSRAMRVAGIVLANGKVLKAGGGN